MTRKRRMILPWVASAFAVGVVGYCLYLAGWEAEKQPGSNGVVVEGNIVYTTRPLRPGEMQQLLTVPFPPAARDFQFAEYGEWLVHEFYLSFRAPPDVCVAYAQKVLDEHNAKHPDETVLGLKAFSPPVESPYAPARVYAPNYLAPEEMPVYWFRPDLIREGVESGERLRAPKVWVDTDRGIFYYEYCH